MPDGPTEKELFAFEQQYWEAIKNGDAALSARLSDEMVMVAHQHIGVKGNIIALDRLDQ